MTDQYLNAGIPTQDDKIVAAQGFATLIGFLISMVTMIVPFAIVGLLILAVLAFLFYGLWAAISFSRQGLSLHRHRPVAGTLSGSRR